MDVKLSDDDRRKNAENAIFMLSKFLNLGLEDEDEEGDEDDCEDNEDEKI